jgi:hypothetical protein
MDFILAKTVKAKEVKDLNACAALAFKTIILIILGGIGGAIIVIDKITAASI